MVEKKTNCVKVFCTEGIEKHSGERYPYAANRRSSEVHKVNCEWAKKISPISKGAYRELAIKHGYNGCRYCLPEYDPC